MNNKPTETTPFSVPAYDEVRWAFIGVGDRGTGHVARSCQLEGGRVTALCDPYAPTLERAVNRLQEKMQSTQDKAKSTPALYGEDGDTEAWRRVLERDDVDVVVISTPWEMHAEMAVAAMQAGKHALIEVPAAITVEECWQLVDTAEATQKHCMMLENCNYGREELMLFNMVRQGLLGEILHGEAAYMHELRKQMFNVEHGEGAWRTAHLAYNQGNLYPTHGVGPIAHCMDVNRGDYFSHIVSMSSMARGRELYAREKLPPDHKWNQVEKWNCGDVNTSIIQLNSGRTMMVQWDETSPRPYSRHNYLQGTKGAFGSYPNRIALDYALEELPEAVRESTPSRDGRTNFHKWDMNMEPWFECYDHPMWRKVGEIAQEQGGHGGMDYIMVWRIQQALLEGKPLDQSVYDAALWSSIMPLSRASIEQKSAPQEFPDFTRGRWKTTLPLVLEV